MSSSPTTVRFLGPKGGAATLTFNNRAYTVAVGGTIDVPFMDAATCAANGWIQVASGSGTRLFGSDSLSGGTFAFIDKNGVILEIDDMQPGDPNLPDNMLPRTRSESDQVYYALEMNLHWFSLNGIKPGEKILPPPSTLKP